MSVDIVTKQDLQEFRLELLKDLKLIVSPAAPSKKWLKSHEVRKLLNISPGTLQNLRINGTLPFTKIGSIMYYNEEDIQQALSQNVINHGNKGLGI